MTLSSLGKARNGLFWLDLVVKQNIVFLQTPWPSFCGYISYYRILEL